MKNFRGKLAVLCVSLCLVSGAVMAQRAGGNQQRLKKPQQGARSEQMRQKVQKGREFAKNHPELKEDLSFLKESRKEMRTLSQKYQDAKTDKVKQSVKAEMTHFASRVIDAKNRVQKVKLADDQKKLEERRAKFDEQIAGKDKAVKKLVQTVLSGKKGEKGNKRQAMNTNRKAGKNDRAVKSKKAGNRQNQKMSSEMREQRKEVASLVKQYKKTDDSSEKKALEKQIRSKVASGYDQKLEDMEKKLDEKKSAKDQQIDKMVERILEGKQGRR